MRRLTEEEVLMQGNLYHICFKPVDEIYLLQDCENEKIYRVIHKNKDHDIDEWRYVCVKNDKWHQNLSC